MSESLPTVDSIREILGATKDPENGRKLLEGTSLHSAATLEDGAVEARKLGAQS